MFLISVAPVSRGFSKGDLTYYSKDSIDVGTLIEVSLRNKKVPALVLKCQEAKNLKAEIRSSSFKLKPVSKTKGIKILTNSFIKTAQKISETYASNLGATLEAVVPKIIWEQPIEIRKEECGRLYDVLAIQEKDDSRFAHYKSIIREEFAKGLSVFFCLPTVEDIVQAQKYLEKGIEKYTFVLHSKLSKKEMSDSLSKISKSDHPLLIIATGPFMAVPHSPLGTIIVEKEHSSGYKMMSRPFIDIRNFAEVFGKELNAKVIFGSMFLRTETIWRVKNNKIASLSPLTFRSASNTENKLIEFEVKKKEDEFSVLHYRTIEYIQKSKENNERTFILASRKGLAPLTVCADCGTLIKGKHSNAPMILHKVRGKNVFICPKTGETRSSDTLCKHCGGWNLVPLGVGTERIQEELKKKLPKTKVFLLDKQNTKTTKQARAVVEKFYSTPGSVLIGTEMALFYLHENIENTVIASIDSLFSIPDFRINEKVMRLALEVRALADSIFILQTRQEKNPVLGYAISGNILDFYHSEIKEREAFGYPPFSTLIKISRSGKQKNVEEDMKKIEKMFENQELYVFPAFISKIGGSYTMNALLKIKPEDWPNEEVLSKLRSLPPLFTVQVDPESPL